MRMIKPALQWTLPIIAISVVLLLAWAFVRPGDASASPRDGTPAAFMPVILRQGTPTATVTLTPAPTATVTPTPTPTTPPAAGWLGYINSLRALGDLPALTENTSWGNGCWLHSRYMVKNDVIQHSEDSGNPWYTAEGQAAAQNSDLSVSSSTGMTDEDAIDSWMSGPFHGVGILDPALAVSGFGAYREADGGWQTGACLDVLRGLGSVPPSVTFPVKWPGDGEIMPYSAFWGGESPNPLSSCSGYSAPSGPPIYLMIGSGSLTPSVTAHSFQQGSTPLDHCIFDETSYTNPSGSDQNLGRAVLNMRDAIIMPRAALTPGATYTVSITTNGQTYTWSFIVSDDARVLDGNVRLR